MDVTLLGTGALLPIPERFLSAAYVSFFGSGILFDCGEGTQVAARSAKISFARMNLIALTHYHGDHIFGIPGLLQSMGAMERREPLYITGPDDLERELEPLLRLAGALPYTVELVSVPKDGLRLPMWRREAALFAFPTRHRAPSQGYVLTLSRAGAFLPEKARALGIHVRDWQKLQRGETVAGITPDQVMTPPRRGLKFVFSGDTAQCPSLIEAGKDADLMVLDATYALDTQREQATLYGHMTFSQAASVARDAGCRQMWLTHFSQMQKAPEENAAYATQIFPNTRVGFDGMRETLRYRED
ncbi:MAG: ribonuclease Z [Christensenellales bacterium]|jgi:ribonuclease Z